MHPLQVLAIDHPQHMIRDTAFYRPLQLLVHSDRPSLRALAKVVLNKDVQTGEHGAVRRLPDGSFTSLC